MAWNRAALEAFVRAMRATASAATAWERPRMRRGGRHRYATGVQAAEESRNEVEAGRIDQQHALAGNAHVLQASRDGSSSPIELGVGQTGVIGLAVEQMDEGRLPRAFVGVAAQREDQGAGKWMRMNVDLVVKRHGSGSPR